ncbi:hypothetical protein AVO45_08630 [Ruegeria marisrubri]|uniref:Lipoprotein n=1 Tax=Ruegeria marisrubri TaxID=1685379 RepID=A0A0X3TQN3_9RHOB|nr:hypothetical protein [Ruegeria marisrubri]KUJ78023.1 hypothetical protein AVO45_08630 [Ruegeria marisrubri]
MFKRLFGIALAFGMAATAPPALAASCAMRDTIIAKLQEAYSEELTFGGLQGVRGGQTVMEVWASNETGTFTVLLTHPNGVSCIVAAGTDFFQASPKEKAKGTAS